MAEHPPFVVQIDDLNHDGRGRGRFGKRTALVSQAYPGEEVLVRADKMTKGTVSGRVLRMRQSSAQRIAHPCVHEFHCTGCPLLAFDAAAEAAFKFQSIEACLNAVLPAETTRDVLRPVETPAGPFGYRYYSKQVFRPSSTGVVLGSYVQGTHRIVDNQGCPVLVPALAELLLALLDEVEEANIPAVGLNLPDGLRYAIARQSHAFGTQLLTLVCSGSVVAKVSALAERLLQRPHVAGVHVLCNDADPNSNVLLAGAPVAHFGDAAIRDVLLGFEHKISAQSFFQINPVSAARLFEYAVQGAGAGTHCLELYAGVGALTLPLAKNFTRVTAVESSAESSRLLEEGARLAGLTHITAHAAPVQDVLPDLLGQQPEVVVMDPPRRGMGAMVAAQLGASSVARVVLLSCDPASLQADLPPLLDAGFKLSWVQPVDQFPRTAHVETVSLLER